MHRFTLLALGFALTAGGAVAEPLFERRAIFPYEDFHNHSSSLVECPNGDLLACWFHGVGERGDNNSVVLGSRLRNGQSAWDPPFTLADTPNLPDCNPVLFIDPKERLWLFRIAVIANEWQHSLLRTLISTDYQKSGPPTWTWQDALILTPGEEFPETVKQAFQSLNLSEPAANYVPKYSEALVTAASDKLKRQTGWMTRIRPRVLDSGRILLPLYSDGFKLSLMALSDDAGETWRPSLPIVGLGPIQPAVAIKNDGTLVAYLRDSGPAPKRILRSESSDQGMTWSPAIDTEIPNPGSSVDVLTLRNGRWVMVHNNAEEKRYNLRVALSEDEGATWKWERYLGDSEKEWFAYPCILEGADGRIHVSYSHTQDNKKSIRHDTINEDWIREEDK
ncbi:MAG: hypothetical protein GHCLOJNM_04426 [bacterium]|nr:hypothetical protein [bacterium]